MQLHIWKEKGYTKETVRIEYEWKPPRCSKCKLFGHVDNNCPLNVTKTVTAQEKDKPHQKAMDAEGFQQVTYKHKGKKNEGFMVGHGKPKVIDRFKKVQMKWEVLARLFLKLTNFIHL